jgi:hypothetical protein
MPALTNISNTTATAVSTNNTTLVTYGVTVKADGANPGYIYAGIGNTVTAALANTNTTGDNTVGMQLAASASFVFTPAHFKRAGVTAYASNVYVIASAVNQRVFVDSI